MKVTIDWLESQEGCKDEVKIFANEWPDGVEVTPENLARAVDLDLNISWLAGKMLKGEARADYRKAVAHAWAARKKAVAAAWVKYWKADLSDSAWNNYKKSTAVARATFYRSILPHVIAALCKEESK